jgi:outer membrane protein assembly factor BamB
MRRSLIAVLLVAAGCATMATPTEGPGTFTTPGLPALATPSLTVPIMEPEAHDVLTYRGDSARTGAMPGPGPSSNPHVVWQFQADGPIGSSVAVIGGTVFLVSGDGEVHALDLETGAEIWTESLGAEAGAASPLVVSGSLFIGDMSGALHAIDPNRGAELWTFRADGPISGAAGAAGELVVAATTAGTAYAVDATSGEVAWQSKLPGGVSRSIAVSADGAYFGAAGGWLVALRVADGTPMWQTRLASSGHGGTPAFADGLVYAATGISTDEFESKGVAAVDASSGEIRWHYASPAMAQVFTPAVVDGVAYVVGQDAAVVALDARTGSEVWSAETNGPNSALAAIAAGVVYVASDEGAVFAFDAPTGELIWRADLIEGKAYAPVVSAGYVIVGTSRGVLYAIGDGNDD